MRAYLFDTRENQAVRCHLCHHRCRIKTGQRGLCQVRENRQGVLYTLVYGRLIAQNVDPIEKKPLFHLLPGSLSYSVATVGCNFKCKFCQNADIAQLPADHQGKIIGDPVEPEMVVADALRRRCASIAYTYTEPTIFFEWAYETAKRAHAQGLLNVFVTNGYMTPEALEKIQPYLDAANVDLKAFDKRYYRDVCGARLDRVKETLVLMKSLGIWVEVTTLVVPGLNDDPHALKALAHFIVTALGPETPWHISRFHPTYKLTDRPPTPVQTLIDAREIGIAAGLKYVYTGNVPGEVGESTYCADCGQVVIERWGFTVRRLAVEQGCCTHCGATVDGRWS